MLSAEIRQRFSMGTRFVSREDRTRRVRYVQGFVLVSSLPPTSSTSPDRAQNGDEELLMHDNMGYWPSLCDVAPDLIGSLLGALEITHPELPLADVARQVLEAPAISASNWSELQARIARDAEEARVRAAQEIEERRAERTALYARQETERRAAAAEAVERERMAERRRVAAERLRQAAAADSHIAGAREQLEHIAGAREQLEQLTNSLQGLLSEAVQVLGRMNERLKPPEKTDESPTEISEENERRLLFVGAAAAGPAQVWSVDQLGSGPSVVGSALHRRLEEELGVVESELHRRLEDGTAHLNRGANTFPPSLSAGTAHLDRGRVTVETAALTSESRIQLYMLRSGSGGLEITNRIPGRSFEIRSTHLDDNRTVEWSIVNG